MMRGFQPPRQRSLAIITLIIALLAIGQLLGACEAGPRKHKRFVIHVPFSVKTHHHTHTVYSTIHSGGTKQTVYKILGYSTHGNGGNGNGHAHGHGHGHGHGGYGGGGGGHGAGHEHGQGEILYDDMHGCDGHNHGDMIFNHYSRNDEDYPDVEEYEDEEQGDEWE